MTRVTRSVGMVLAGLLIGTLSGTALVGQPEPGPDGSGRRVVAQVRSVVEGFERALARGDTARAVSYLHPEVRVYEGGHAETLDQYRSGHLGADAAFLGAVEKQTTWHQIVPGTDMALYMGEYRMTGTFRERDIDAHGTETYVLVPVGSDWRIRHIHWSSR